MSSNMRELAERATSDMLIQSDWRANMDIVDKLNRTSGSGAGDVIMVVRNRLTSEEERVQLIALALLEAVMKNCYCVLDHVNQPGFLRTLADHARDANASYRVKNKIAALVRGWAEGIGSGGRFNNFYKVYAELKAINFPFPGRDPNEPPYEPPQGPRRVSQPVQAQVPQYDTRVQYPASRSPIAVVHPSAGIASRPAAVPASGGAAGSVPAIQDVSQRVDVSLNSMNLLMEMLYAINPREERVESNDLVQELMRDCKATHNDVKTILESGNIPPETILGRMLEFNDKMVEADDAYGTLCAGRKAVKPLSKDATNSAASSQQPLNMNSLLELQQDSPSPPHMVPPTQPQQRDQAPILRNAQMALRDSSDFNVPIIPGPPRRGRSKSGKAVDDSVVGTYQQEQNNSSSPSTSTTVPHTAPAQASKYCLQPAQSPSDPFELLSQPNDNASVHASTTSAVSGDDLADPFSMLAMRHNPHGSGGSSSQQSSAAQIGASGGFDLLGDAPIQPTPAHPQGEQKAAGKPSASVYDHIDELFAVSSAPPTQANTQYFLPRTVGERPIATFPAHQQLPPQQQQPQYQQYATQGMQQQPSGYMPNNGAGGYVYAGAHQQSPQGQDINKRW